MRWLRLCVVLPCLFSLVNAIPAFAADHPKTDILDRFDEEQSPLQKGMLDARDNKWRKSLRLGSDPRCSQLVRTWAKDPSATDQDSKTIERLCVETDSQGLPVYLGQDGCLEKHCGADTVGCASALIYGTDVDLQCAPPGARLRSIDGTRSAAAMGCVESLFKDGAIPGHSGKGLDCLEDPYKNTCSPDDPNCVPELRPECGKVFDLCDEMPFIQKAERVQGRSGEIREGGRKIGKRIQTRTVIHYDQGGQRRAGGTAGKATDGWDSIQIQPSHRGDARNGIPGASRTETGEQDALSRRRVLGSASFESGCDPAVLCAQNEDADCVDSITGLHYGKDQCFGTGTELLSTLELLDPSACSPFDICCRHVGTATGVEGTGRVQYGDDCLVDPALPAPGNLRTTLVQLIDEDPAGDTLNNDGDCRIAGITPAQGVTSDCLDAAGKLRAGYEWNLDEEGEYTPGGACEDPSQPNKDNDCRVMLEAAGTCSVTVSMGCHDDLDCPSGESCVAGLPPGCDQTCPAKICSDIGSPCDDDSDCHGGSFCIDNDPANCNAPGACHRGITVIGSLDAGGCALTFRSLGGPVTALCDPASPQPPCYQPLTGEDCLERSAGEVGVNNDGDCKLAGTVPPQGITSDCLDAAGQLRAGYEWNVNEDPPTAATSSLVPLDEDKEACRAYYQKVGEENGVTLAPPDEDELPNGERGCDLTRAMRVHVNGQLKRWKDQGDPTFDKFQRKTKKERIFDVDDNGYWCGHPKAAACPDASDPQQAGKRGLVHPDNPHQPRADKSNRSYKYEERQVTVDEVFAVRCKPVKDKATGSWLPTSYDEATGDCVTATLPVQSRLGARSESRLAPTLSRVPALLDPWTSTCDQANPPPECFQAMMGFTFAPPVLEWGWRIKEEVCIFGFCIEIFYARIGYEFDLAAGIRLPVEIQFEDVPATALATRDFNVKTRLEPVDFSVDDFKAFCALHDLDAPWYIASCDRFSFPDFMDGSDGDEFVAHYSVFAGIIVRLFYIPLINWAIDSAVDIPAMCTAWKMLDGVEGMSLEDMIRIEMGLLDGEEIAAVLKENLGNCGSFTTPFGVAPCDDCTTGERLRGWPFLSLSKHIRADCLDAMLHGEYVTVKGRKIPICTGMILGTSGASLGVGLGIEATAGSRLVTTDWSGQGDAAGGDELEYSRSAGEPGSDVTLGPVNPDDYTEMADGSYQDDAVIALDDFTYYLNAIEIALSANLEFGGILSPIPDIGDFTLYNFVFDTTQLGWRGIPVPQHPGTEPVKVAVPVINYALGVDVRPDSAVTVPPGCAFLPGTPADVCPDYPVWVANIGSVQDSFDNFQRELSNRQKVTRVDTGDVCPLEFRIDLNNDHDCLVGADRRRGDPFDGIADDCYDACGLPLAGVVESENEDPPGCTNPGSDGLCSPAESDEDGDGFVDEDGPADDWTASWLQSGQQVAAPEVTGVAAHSQVTDALTLSVSPLRHPFTAPGIYPFRVTADSMGAKAQSPPLPASGPGALDRFRRMDAPDVGYLEVISFFDPVIDVQPPDAVAGPGESRTFTAWITNGSNSPDAIVVSTHRVDFNVAGCDLVTLGSGPGCPYRAVPTAIPAGWLLGGLPGRFPADAGSLMQQAGYDSGGFGFAVPSDWAGMQDTTYQYEVTVTSTQDPGMPPASNTFVVEQVVLATQESMTRYIGAEIDALIAEVEAANAAGIDTGGLLPIPLHPMRQTNERALDRAMTGNTSGASNAHSSNVRITGAFLHALDGYGSGKLPVSLMDDWRARAEAILADLDTAIAAW